MVLLRTKRQLRLESCGARGGDLYIELTSDGAEINVNDQIQFSLSAEDIATMKHFLVNAEVIED
jgi:hypothetical protein